MSDGECGQRETSVPVAERRLETNEGEGENVHEIEEEASLAEMEEYEEEARRLLAGQEMNSCTYTQGYIPRQALYACKTCTPDGGAGICFGCSMNCHDGHDLIELYTKRRFKCDCGNGAFKEKCKLFEDKAPRNERNAYNHNFVNEYCMCKRPFPDPEVTVHEELLQCIACEDWFHLSHTGIAENLRADYADNEYVCKDCCEKMPFLDKLDRNAPEETEMKVLCSKETREEGTSISGVLLKNHWRKRLCNCSKCEDLYDKLGADWIHDEDDSLEKYNELAEKKMKEEDEEKEKELTKFMQGQDRDVVINVMSEVNKMKRKMAEYMERMGSNAVVTADHIKELFDGMKKEREEQFNRRMEEISEGKGGNGDEDRLADGEH
ncbi:hypothetical protein PENTCL1PPCAC_22649 [Pristionchus entomophagus]|uniref:UBR-type domain-containing protein n=1 Tax=Pristionchus entomophagus TaxID=358040 RepID=A0AAV5U222_9BILA|nr:hypothetical protein PENTCL1PPCAC_22649 [Pristionchus entomophagus]